MTAIILTTSLIFTACGSETMPATDTPGTEADDISTVVKEETQPAEVAEEPEPEPTPVEQCGITAPSKENGQSVWHCVWFGNYWQDIDSDGDGKVTQTDDKEPIKWRILDIDDEGNALLLSDKLLDITEYNPGDKEVTWETCTYRSFLNSYDGSANAYEIDYSSDGFLNNAFSADEKEAIVTSKVVNENNPVYGTEGGNDTEDKVFSLSVMETMNPDYGFTQNEFIGPDGDQEKFYTDADPGRVAATTGYADAKGEGFNGEATNRSSGLYWLRTSGYSPKYPGHVNLLGGAYAISVHMDENRVYLRPALNINLNESDTMWCYAGKVYADGSVRENVDDIDPPITRNETGIWDCIWFGNYWQDTDSNGDGKVTEEDIKEPIKWRVLDIDEDGNAFLLADKNIDILAVNPDELDITWETGALRSYLNCYDASSNVFKADYSSTGFMKKAFTDAEIDAIKTTKIETPDNPVYGTDGGNDTEDKIFCLSLEDTINPDYGFLDNELSEVSPMMEMWLEDHDTEGGDHTPDNPTRKAITTGYMDAKEYNFGNAQLKETDRSPSVWWLRSSGYNYMGGTTYKYPGHVNGAGSSYAISIHMDDFRVGLRPALVMNIKENTDLWSYAGTVSSDDTIVEVPHS